MRQFQIQYKSQSDFNKRLAEIKNLCEKNSFSDIIFYITWTETSQKELKKTTVSIKKLFPDAIYYGTEASGDIAMGEFTLDINVTCFIFEKKGSKAELVWVEKGTEFPSLKKLWQYCKTKKGLRAIEMIPSISYIGALGIDCNIPDISKDVLIFGGASINYNNPTFNADIIAKGHKATQNGMAVILYYGKSLSFTSNDILGWKGLGQLMEVTDSIGSCIKEIDNSPAYSVYEKYLNLSADDKDTLVFPLIAEEDGNEYIRTPQAIMPDKSMRMFVDVPKGTKVRIAYGDKNTILDGIYDKAKELAKLNPEAIKAYSCAGRRVFWGDEEVGKETKILQEIAPVCGFYTGGEILRFGKKLRVLNQTLAIITISESSKAKNIKPVDIKTKAPDKSLVSRLAYFTEKVREEQRKNIKIITGLASQFTALYHVNLDTGLYIPYHLTKMTENIKPYIAKYPKFEALAHKFAQSDLVHPDFRGIIKGFYPSDARIKETLKDRKSISLLFKRNYNGKYLWTELFIIKCEDTAEDAHNIIVGFIEKDEEISRKLESDKLLKQTEEAKKLIEAITASYNIAYIVNMADDSFKLLRMDDNIIGKGENFSTFSEAKEFFLNLLPPSDKERMSYELDYDTIRRNLFNTKSYTVEYRALIKGVTIWHEMSVAAINKDFIALGFAIKDLEIIRRHLEEKKFEENFALFVVDLDTEMLKVLKNEENCKILPVGGAAPYSKFIKEFAKVLSEEPKAFFMQLADINFVKNELANENKRTYTYKWYFPDGEKWIDVTTRVILRHDDGTPAMFTFEFSFSDTLATTRKDVQNQIKEDMQMIGGLAREYHALYYFNMDEGFFKVYSIDEKRFPEAKMFLKGQSTNPVETFHKFGASPLVHPDDRKVFEDLNPEKIREILAHKKKFTSRFRRRFGNEYFWTKMEIIKYEDIDERANIVALGFAERDAEIRSEQTLSRCFDILGKGISPDEAIDELLSLAGDYYGAERTCIFEFGATKDVVNNSFEWCREGVKPMIPQLQNIPAMKIESMMDDGIVIPIMSGDVIEGYIGVDTPTKAVKNIDVLKTIAVVTCSELLKHKQTQVAMYQSAKIFSDTFLDAYVSAYYVNLMDCSMVVFHQDKLIQESYGHIKNYLLSVIQYINECVHPEDQQKMYEAVQPIYIKERLKKESKFSLYMRDISREEVRWYRFDVKKGADDNHAGLALSDVTELLGEEKRKAQQLQEDMEMIGGLASEYLALYYANFSEKIFRVFSIDGKRLPDTKQLLTEDDDPVALIRKFAQSPAVHPDDQKLFNDLNKESIIERLNGTKKFTIRFRRNYGNGYLWSVMDVIKYEKANERANVIAIGFGERDKEICLEFERERQIKELNEKLLEASIQSSINQMQPHFMYNALASIRELVLDNPEYASDLIFDFTTHLRACIKSMNFREPVPFDMELENIKSYINIEKMRFGKRLTMKYDLKVTDFKVVPLGIQPLVENAVKHGACQRGPKGGTVTLKTYRDKEGCVIIQVIDNGVGFDYEKIKAEVESGKRIATGIRNFVFRFEKIMHAKVDIDSKIGIGTTITIKLPKQK